MKRSVLAVAIASVLALVGCALVVLYVSGADARALAGKEAARVLIATKRIPAGTTGAEIKKGGYVEVVMMPKTSIPNDVVDVVDASLEDLALTADVQARQLLLRGAFAAPTDVSGGLNIPEGKVAVTVSIINTAGTVFLQPGSKVALYDTFTLLEGRNGVPAGDGLARDHAYNQATRLLLPSVEVVATGVGNKLTATNGSQSGSGDAGSGGVLGGDKDKPDEDATSTLVTVAVTQDEAERLIHATQTGTLYIALLDGSSTLRPGPGVDNNSLFN
jgi:pilus assembly protein CpaB